MHARRIAVIAVVVLCALSALAQSELRLPPDQTAEATGPGGAIVHYNASGTGIGDDENGRPLTTAVCSPASGSLFPLGTTTVTCSAGNPPATGTFKVNVVDRTPPSLSLPREIRAKATSSAGAVVTYSASATDLVDGSVSVACSPASGSTFAVGSTTVNCSASDSRGNSASDSFVVDVSEDAPPPPPPTQTLPDVTVQATSANGAVVTFNIATYGDDENGRTRGADCTPPSGSLFAVGTTDVSCKFTNQQGQVTIGTFHVIVLAFVPTTGPSLLLPGNITVEATSPDGAVVNYTASAVDGNGSPIPIACAPASGSLFAIGTTSVACSATDGSGNTASGAFSVTVTDSTAPVITRVTATPDVLSPPNHALVPVTISVEFSDEGDNAPVARVYDVTANEPVIGPGSGNTNCDWLITGPLTVELRAERSGQGNSRVYTVWVEVIDSNGNRSTASTNVTVPKGNDNLQSPVTTPPPPGRRRVSGR